MKRNVGWMTPVAVVRLSWAVLALPMAALFLTVSLAMWPLVLQNSPARLGLIAYVVACPLLPLFWRGGRVPLVLGVAVLTLTAQLVAVSIINFWF